MYAPEISCAAGRQVRNVYRLLVVRISLAPAFDMKCGICAASARRAVATPTSLSITPPIAITWSCSVRRLNASMPPAG
jgi:hypothetical protein